MKYELGNPSPEALNFDTFYETENTKEIKIESQDWTLYGMNCHNFIESITIFHENFFDGI